MNEKDLKENDSEEKGKVKMDVLDYILIGVIIAGVLTYLYHPSQTVYGAVIGGFIGYLLSKRSVRREIKKILGG